MHPIRDRACIAASRLRTALLILFLPASSAFAQAPSLAGRVVDSTGAVLPGVTVEATAVAGGSSRITTTGPDGTYAFALSRGTYDVSFQLLNFARVARRGIVVSAAAPGRADATLYLASSADVVVTAKADLSQPRRSHRAGQRSDRDRRRRDPGRRDGQGDRAPPVPTRGRGSRDRTGRRRQSAQRRGEGQPVLPARVQPRSRHRHRHHRRRRSGQHADARSRSGLCRCELSDPRTDQRRAVQERSVLRGRGRLRQRGSSQRQLREPARPSHRIRAGRLRRVGRALYAASPKVGDGYLLYAIEAGANDGPWVRPDDFRKLNGVVRYTRGDQRGGFSITAMGYGAKWSSTDQIPGRAVAGGTLSRFGHVDSSDGGRTSRYALVSEWQRNSSNSLTQAAAYGIKYRLNLFSNFTYFLDHPSEGDQFEQADDRLVAGARGSHRWLARWGSVSAENVAGVQARHDAIGNVGLYHTQERVRLGTTRQDRVHETSAGAFLQTALQWSPWLRTIAGVRADRYRFDVDANDARNSGRTGASMLSPKLTAIFGPWRNTELYANAGSGFHSNDARGATIRVDPATGDPAERVTPLVRTRGAEVGLRTTPVPRFHATAALWGLDIASELLFVGDAGTTEASRPSRRTGVELATFYNLSNWLALDAEYAYSRARFRDTDPAGDRIPGSVEGVASLGLNVVDLRRLSGELRYRYFGPRPLLEDNSVRSDASSLLNARIGYRIAPRIRLDVDVFNILDARVSDIDYFYTSRLRGEAPAGIEDVHFHPVEKRAVRLGFTTSF